MRLMQEGCRNMKKIQKIISCLCIMCMLICMSNTIAWAEEMKSTETKSVESVQQMINELPSMHEINDTNKDAVIAQLDAVDDAKLQLSDEEIMQIDFTKYNAVAFVLSDSLDLAYMEILKTYPDTVGPTAEISFLNENGQMETILQEGSGGVSTCSSVEPVPNGAATYAYIEAGHYTLNEEVEGEWNASLTVNGQPVEGMEVDFEAGKFYSVMLTNSPPETTNISGEIIWDDADNQDGKRPEQVVIKLVEDGGTIERTVGRLIGRNVTVTADADWKYSFKDLPKYREGREIVYGVNVAVEGYTFTTTGYDIKCTHTPETIDVTGTITWEDADDQDGKRPEKVKVELLANGESIGKTKTVTAKDNWSYRFKDLPQYKAGKEIEYTIKNEDLEGYTLKIDDNNNLTYSKIEEKTETPEDKKPVPEDKEPISEDKKPISEDKKPVSEDKTSTSNAPTTSVNGVSSNPTQTNGASSNSVPTGDSNNLWLAGVLFIVALCRLCVSIKKRSNTDK